MNEINKLRARLRNTDRRTTVYTMSITEARTLLGEIDHLLAPPITQEPLEVVVNEPTVITRTMDGGTF